MARYTVVDSDASDSGEESTRQPTPQKKKPRASRDDVSGNLTIPTRTRVPSSPLTRTLCTPRRPRLHHGISRPGVLPPDSHATVRAAECPLKCLHASPRRIQVHVAKVHARACNCDSRVAHIAPSFFGQTGFLAADTPTSLLESPPEGRDRDVYPLLSFSVCPRDTQDTMRECDAVTLSLNSNSDSAPAHIDPTQYRCLDTDPRAQSTRDLQPASAHSIASRSAAHREYCTPLWGKARMSRDRGQPASAARCAGDENASPQCLASKSRSGSVRAHTYVRNSSTPVLRAWRVRCCRARPRAAKANRSNQAKEVFPDESAKEKENLDAAQKHIQDTEKEILRMRKKVGQLEGQPQVRVPDDGPESEDNDFDDSEPLNAAFTSATPTRSVRDGDHDAEELFPNQGTPGPVTGSKHPHPVADCSSPAPPPKRKKSKVKEPQFRDGFVPSPGSKPNASDYEPIVEAVLLRAERTKVRYKLLPRMIKVILKRGLHIRGKVLDGYRPICRTHYGFQHGNSKAIIAANMAKAKALLHKSSFHYKDPATRTGYGENKIIADARPHYLFKNKKSFRRLPATANLRTFGPSALSLVPSSLVPS
ncbi:hypothetical protein B0H10DRAFT_2437411 [Mycena sp. CBHHK59/15]|nr:hypothetical protein B0H10DRAFT_2437411 [Mycena sp. CBHHK59/15]